MKQKLLITALTVGFAAAAPALMYAQDSAAPATPAASTAPAAAGDAGTPAPTGGKPTPEQLVAQLGQKLSLNDLQKQQLLPIFQERQDNLKSLASDSSTRKLKKKRESKSILKDSDAKIQPLLTADQWTKYQAWESEMKDKNKK